MAKNPKDGESRTFLISVAAELAGMHAQTLRTYDRLGLVSPRRTSGGGRRYSLHDVELLRQVQHLSQDEGVNETVVYAFICLFVINVVMTAIGVRISAQ